MNPLTSSIHHYQPFYCNDEENSILESPSINQSLPVILEEDVQEKSITKLFQKIDAHKSIQAQSESLSKLDLRKQHKVAKIIKKADRKAKSESKKTYKVVIPSHKMLTKEEIEKLRYSQDSIQKTTSDGIKLETLAENMAEEWKVGTHLTVVKMPDENLVSLNNRRLYAAQLATEMKEVFELPVAIFAHEDPAPKKLLSGIITEYQKGRELDNINEVAKEILQNSYGHSVVLRMNTRKGELSKSSYGYEDKPIVRE